jgi:glyoxylase-like metal-dependent hydrolase (beta-lactamase superfamily II)
MKLRIIETELFKLDGGAMFGVVPRVLWDRVNPADEKNQCTWAMRCLLIEHKDRKILVDCGVGYKQDKKFMDIFGVHGNDTMLGSLAKEGVQPSDITDVLITHLHFDHVGGAVSNEGEKLIPTFPNATYWTSKSHFDWAMYPNSRERASFLKENFVPLQDEGVLKFVEESEEVVDWMDNIRIWFVHGHTQSMMLPIIHYDGKQAIYCADLIPSAGHLPMPWVMAYDLQPLETLKEKSMLYKNTLNDHSYLIFEHDPSIAGCTIMQDERGKIRVKDVVDVNTIF